MNEFKLNMIKGFIKYEFYLKKKFSIAAFNLIDKELFKLNLENHLIPFKFIQ